MSHGFIKTMLISTLQRLSLRVSYPFNRKVVALNKRLNRMNMMIWWEGDEYFINQTAADKRFGVFFYLDDDSLGKLMAMSDERLETFLKHY